MGPTPEWLALHSVNCSFCVLLPSLTYMVEQEGKRAAVVHTWLLQRLRQEHRALKAILGNLDLVNGILKTEAQA